MMTAFNGLNISAILAPIKFPKTIPIPAKIMA
jgi:hypothetical protein